jgi:hypothetical protein
VLDRQEKLIELNQKKLIPENELANLLHNIKGSSKTIYTNTLGAYLEESVRFVADLKSAKKKKTV